MSEEALAELRALWDAEIARGPFVNAEGETREVAARIVVAPKDILGLYESHCPSFVEAYVRELQDHYDHVPEPQGIWDGLVLRALYLIGEHRPGEVAEAILDYAELRPLTSPLISAMSRPADGTVEERRVAALERCLFGAADDDGTLIAATVNAMAKSTLGQRALDRAMSRLPLGNRKRDAIRGPAQ